MHTILFALTLITLCTQLLADIKRCRSPGGDVVYTDRHCPATHTQQQEKLQQMPLNVARGLSAQEKDSAIELYQRNQRRNESRLAQRHAAARALREKIGHRAEQCMMAKEGLESLRVRRRSGYGLSEMGELKRREGEYRRLVVEFCSS